MTNKEKYEKILMDVFGLNEGEVNENLNALNVERWDSMGQMRLAGALEEAFEVFLDPEDMIQLISYSQGMEVLKKHGIAF